METSDYLPMFLAEGREHLQELNLAVVRIEEAPGDRETVDEIFRIAHSMKGMSATMGFARMAALTHEMENVFELLRQRTGGLKREAIDVLLKCLDALSGAVEAIDTEGVEKLEHETLVVELKSLVRERTPEQEDAFSRATPTPADLEAKLRGRRVLHANVELSDEAQMPAVRAYMILAAAGDHGEVIESAPTAAEVENFDGRVVQVWIETDHEAETVAATLGGVPDVGKATVLAVKQAAAEVAEEE